MAATDAAEKLAKKMGSGWKPRVWENMGWHYDVSNGVVRLSPFICRGELVTYTVYFNTVQQVVASSKKPKKAMRKAIKKVKANIAQTTADLAFIERKY